MDEYSCFRELSEAHQAGLDYAVRLRQVPGTVLVLAPHGGGIEPGTSEIADAIAGTDYSFYAFEGVMRTDNGRLHITSHHFDEPQCVALLDQATWVLAIHGKCSREPAVFIGGANCPKAERIKAWLLEAGLPARAEVDPGLRGVEPMNICNRASRAGGVQLELSDGFRRLLFKDLTASGRRRPTAEFHRFITVLRDAVARA